MAQDKVSVIMGIYNCEYTIEEAIKSILNQTYNNWELIMCDDCSTDNTYGIADQYRSLYPDKIILLKNQYNSGLSMSLNHCLKHASGELIARMDGDDISLPDRFKIQVRFLNDYTNFEVVGCSMIRFDDKGDYGFVRSIPFPDKYILRKAVPFCHATILARKVIYDKLNGYTVSRRTIRGQDVDLWFRFFYEGFKGANLEEALYKVREDSSAFKRRAFKYSFNVSQTLFIGFRMLKFPLKYYIYVFKPIISALIPKRFKYLINSKILT